MIKAALFATVLIVTLAETSGYSASHKRSCRRVSLKRRWVGTAAGPGGDGSGVNAAENNQSNKRKLTPLEQALLADRPTGSFVDEGWMEEDIVSDSSLSGTAAHFESFKNNPMMTFADKFFAIDDEVRGRYRDDGWLDPSEPVPLSDEDWEATLKPPSARDDPRPRPSGPWPPWAKKKH
jgi:hypothetical protein